ncbi:enoyl-CoA hydratase/isomerase family protein [Candidatus Entotheonella palauensis]|uniref:enoyl-CoA hydratase/isomerase family protein n=1 Tax=Candidatus Entotheonella palauensis TaxID=93172 RepID=UPI0015C41E9C|nr:enoyl-CoA hydratase/isomerase family protein [Candidatus Entotheonella palauensis]
MIQRDIQDDIAIVRMAHGKVNALDIELLRAICEEFKALEQTSYRAVVLTGVGSCFSAGVDLFRLIQEDQSYLERFLPVLSDAFRAVFQFPRPVIGAAGGHAIAGGAVLLCCCDYRLFADTQARMGVPELHVGVPFPSIALEILRFCVSRAHFQDIIYSGETFVPSEALRRGLVDEVIPSDQLIERALTCAKRYASVPSGTYELSKRQLHKPVLDLTEASDDLEAEVNTLWAAQPTREAIQSYLDRLFQNR